MKTTAFFIAILLLATTISSCEQGSNSTSPAIDSTVTSYQTDALVDSAWLKTNLNKENLVLIELGRSFDEYSESHIPNAQFVDWRSDISDQSIPEMYNIVEKQTYEELLSRLGVNSKSLIVLYDTLSNRASTRMYWTLKYYGHPSIRILNGGLDIWKKANYPLTNQIPEVTPSHYQVAYINSNLLVNKQYVSDNLADQNLKLVDGRPFDQYTGEAAGTVFTTGTAHERGGHIYGAKTVPWASNLNADGIFKSAEELVAIYQEHDIINQGTVVTYCNEGFHAAMPWFVLSELLGYEDVRLYDSSMAEWANIFDTPMKTGEHCM